MKRFTVRSIAGIWVVSFVTGCTSYELRVDQPVTRDLGLAISRPSSIPVPFQSLKPYLYIYASMKQMEQSAITPCSDKWVYALARTRVVSMVVSMDISANTSTNNVKVPLYAVSRNNTGCTVSYDHSYIFPREPIVGGAFYAFPIEVLYQNNSTENISGYISSGLALAKTIAPQSVPVITSIETIASSAPAQSLRDAVNTDLGSKTDVTRDLKIIDTNHMSYNDTDTQYTVQAFPFDSQYNARSGAPIRLASLTLSTRWLNSALADDDGRKLSFNSALSMSSRVWVFPNSGGTAQQLPISTYVSLKNNTIESLVENLQPSDTYRAAQSICNQFRLAVSDFNDLDQAALLWLAYRGSALALAGHKHSNGQSYSCMSRSEINALTGMGLPSASDIDPAAAPAPTPAPGGSTPRPQALQSHSLNTERIATR